jgi:large conductance mechanosensitive channel
VVTDLFMPIIGAITGGLDFSNYFLPLSSEVTATTLDAAREQGAVFAYGNFITASINFMIVAWILFIVVKGINRLRAREDAKVRAEPSAPEVPADIKLLAEIRDLLAKNGSDTAPTGEPPGRSA